MEYLISATDKDNTDITVKELHKALGKALRKGLGECTIEIEVGGFLNTIDASDVAVNKDDKKLRIA
jgi:hypothetical protein